MRNAIKIMLVDGHAVVRIGCRHIFAGHHDIEIVAEAIDGEQAYKQYKDFNPDVVIMDFSLPGMSGLELLKQLRSFDSGAAVLVFTAQENPLLAQRLIRAGAKGFLSKSAREQNLIEAVYAVSAGKLYLPVETAQSLAARYLSDCENPVAMLSNRELEIFRLITNGHSNPEIGGILHISPKTVANHRISIKQKLGVSSTAELTRLAIDMGLDGISSGHPE